MSLRVVLNSWGSYGDLFPYLGLGKALQARGHQVTLAVPKYYAPRVEREGLGFHPVGPDVDPNDRALIARVMDAVQGPKVILDEWLMPAVPQSYRELQQAVRGADLLISHPVTFAAPVLAQKLGLPWISTVLAPMSFFSAYDLPVLPAAPALVTLRTLGTWFGRAMVRFAHHATAKWSQPVYDLRASLGLPRGLDPIYEGQFSPLLTLALFSRVLASPQPDWPAPVRLTGNIFYNPHEAIAPDLAAFLDAGPPPVVFTLGSSAVGAPGRFYQESAAAAQRLGVRAVLLTGPVPENQNIGVTSPDIRLVDFAPHAELFPRASAIVHQGGIGTTAQALRAGRPTLVVPYSHDQPDNAYRVGRLGVARTVFPKAYRADRVARELKRLLDDRRYETKAADVARIVASEGGAEAAVDEIEAAMTRVPERAQAR